MCKDPQLAKKLSAAKKSKHRFALICKGPRLLGLLLSQTSLTGLTKLKTELGGNAVYKGVCEGVQGVLVFTVVADKAPTDDVKLTKFIKKLSGNSSLKARFELLEGGEKENREEEKSDREDLRQRIERQLQSEESSEDSPLSGDDNERRWYKLAKICARILSAVGEEANSEMRPIFEKACYFAEKDKFAEAIKLGKAVLKAAPRDQAVAAIKQEDVGNTLKDFVKGQAEKKQFAAQSVGETVPLDREGNPLEIDDATVKRRKGLLKKKIVRLRTELRRLDNLRQALEGAKDKKQAEESRIREMIMDGFAVVKGETAALTQKRGRSAALRKHIQEPEFAGYYQQGAAIAAVPIHQITGMIDALESETVLKDLDAKTYALQYELKENGIKMEVGIDKSAREIRIGKSLVIEMSNLAGEGDAHRLVNLLRRMSTTESGKKLLRRIENSGRRINVVNPTDPAHESFASQEVADKGNEKTRKEKTRERKQREKLQTELADRIAEQKKDEIWLQFEKLVAARAKLKKAMPDTLDHSMFANERREKLQPELDEINRQVQDLLRNNPEAAKLVRKIRSLEEAARNFDETWKKHLDKRDSKVFMATSGKKYDDRKNFHHAGVTEPPPDDAILFHELVHSLNRAEGRDSSHLPSERWFNEDEHSAVLGETEYLEEIGFNWRRDQYDATLGPIDSEKPEELSEAKMAVLEERFGKKRTKGDPDLSKLEETDLSESGELSESN